MRLLHCQTLVLQEFNDAALPPYAILSHTWRAGHEVTLAEMKLVNRAQSLYLKSEAKEPSLAGSVEDLRILSITRKSGYNKIKSFCEEAARDGFEYAWVDTCCIDKTSSSELSEAINSMYRWYQRAEVCYVYLSDVAWGLDRGNPNLEQTSFTRTAFLKSKWFTRGWTLQELIAPASVVFFNNRWEELGTKLSLQKAISGVTGIQVEVLFGAKLESFSVAQRMSWASKRETTRIEDETYCLMGIFGVNMPMLYGEGRRAFQRPQEEIIRNSNDHSILAWSGEGWQAEGGLLARSPAAFTYSGIIIQAQSIDYSVPTMSIGLTNRGVHVRVEPVPDGDRWKRFQPEPLYMSVLNCEELGRPNRLIAILLKRVSGDVFSRVSEATANTGVNRPWKTVMKSRLRQDVANETTGQEDAFVPQRYDLEEPEPYEDFDVQLNVLGEKLEMYPRNDYSTGGLLRYMAQLYRENDDEVAAIRFSGPQPQHPPYSGGSEDIVVLLKREGPLKNVVRATAFVIPHHQSLEDEVWGFVEKDTTAGISRDYGELSDRFVLEHENHRISVIIKRKMTARKRRLVVEISCVKLRAK
jgi:hypothetical protein